MIFITIYFAIAIYFTPLLVGYALTREVTPKEKLIGVWISYCVAICVAIIAITMFWPIRYDLGDHIARVIILSFIVGLGLALGSWVKSHKIKGKIVHSNMLLVVALFFMPMIYLGIANVNASMKENTKLAKENTKLTKLNKLQSLTIADKLGNEAIHIAMSPQLDLRYTCEFFPYRSSQHTSCKEQWKSGKSNNRSKDVSNRDLAAPILRYLKVTPLKESCGAANPVMKPCVTYDTVRTWCDRRGDLADSVWCTNTLESRIEYRYHSAPESFNFVSDAEHWKLETIVPESQDFTGDPVFVFCSIAADEKIAKRKLITGLPNLKPLKRVCEIKYKIATDIGVVAGFVVTGPETLVPQARKAYDNSQSFWQDMKTRKQIE